VGLFRKSDANPDTRFTPGASNWISSAPSTARVALETVGRSGAPPDHTRRTREKRGFTHRRDVASSVTRRIKGSHRYSGPGHPALTRDAGRGDEEAVLVGADGGGGARLLPAIAARERVPGDALVSPDEHVPVDAAPAEAEARCRGNGRGRRGRRRPGTDSLEPQPLRRRKGGRPRTGIVERGWSGERDEHLPEPEDLGGAARGLLRREASGGPGAGDAAVLVAVAATRLSCRSTIRSTSSRRTLFRSWSGASSFGDRGTAWLGAWFPAPRIRATRNNCRSGTQY